MQGIKAGDTIDFHNQSMSVRVFVKSVTRHATFHEMLSKAGVKNVLPEYSSVADAVRLFQSLPGYREKEARMGVLAIHIELLA